MSDLDDKILEALNADEKELVDSYARDLSFPGLIIESFKSKNRVVVIFAMIFIILFAGLFFYSGYYFYFTDEIATKLNWMALGLTALIILGLLRLWFFMELNRLDIVREIKRLELQVSLLAKKIQPR